MPFRARGAKPFSDENSLYEYAVGALGRRMRTQAELRRLLLGRVAPGPAGEALVEGAMGRLGARGYLSDARYAQAFLASRVGGGKLGRRRVALDLRARGVPPEVLAGELDAAFDGLDEAAQARAFLAKKRVRPPADPRESARVFRMLVRAGYGPGTIMTVLKGWRGGAADDLTPALAEDEGESG